jgi:hypothetical protein
MRLGNGSGLWNDDMRVDIDGQRRGAARQAVGIMDPGRGTAIAILTFDHLERTCCWS